MWWVVLQVSYMGYMFLSKIRRVYNYDTGMLKFIGSVWWFLKTDPSTLAVCVSFSCFEHGPILLATFLWKLWLVSSPWRAVTMQPTCNPVCAADWGTSPFFTGSCDAATWRLATTLPPSKTTSRLVVTCCYSTIVVAVEVYSRKNSSGCCCCHFCLSVTRYHASLKYASLCFHDE